MGRYAYVSNGSVFAPAGEPAKISRLQCEARHPIAVEWLVLMILKSIRVSILALLVAGSLVCVAQDSARQHNFNAFNAVAGRREAADSSPAASQPAKTTPQNPPDKAAAYYHFMMAHMYEEMVSMYGRSDYANKAIDEYRAGHR